MRGNGIPILGRSRKMLVLLVALDNIEPQNKANVLIVSLDILLIAQVPPHVSGVLEDLGIV